MQGLAKLIMKSFYGEQTSKDLNESFYCKSEIWMKTEFDENVLDFWKIPNEKYTEKMKKENGKDDDCYIKNTLPALF